MKKILGLGTGIVILLILCGTSLAAPSINGPTGLLRMPTADVIPYKEFNVGVDYSLTTTTTASPEGMLYYKVNLGTFQGLELGIVGGTERGTQRLREGCFINLKFSLSTDDSAYPLKLAVGVENLTSRQDTDVYMVATKYFKQNFVLHFGFMGDFPGDRFRPLGMLGLGIPLFESNFIAMGDLFAGETLFQVDAGIRVYLFPSFALTIGGLNLSNSPISKNPQSVYAGFSWANPF